MNRICHEASFVAAPCRMGDYSNGWRNGETAVTTQTQKNLPNENFLIWQVWDA
ncbi:hypothetical protein [Candidatus Leptofilum sp.]|uniref:hypothetical protein n=1 Tax=Candidatus Leptofilum sp. TaxID=3241576 RepID=UPI003B5BFAD4